MKKTIYAILTMAICTIWSACNEKNDYEVLPPTFKGFTYTPTTPHPGDSVRFTAVYDNPGKNIYFSNHRGITWKLTVDTLDAQGDASKDGKWVKEVKPYCSVGESDPTYKFRIPTTAKPGSTARLDFRADYSNAADGTPGTSIPNQTAQGYYGQFQNSIVQSILYSTATGWMTFRIH